LRITPLDIRNHPFPRSLGGYTREEVDAFLGMVSDDYEGQLRESESLREQVIRLEAQVEGLSANEAVLQETLTTAHRLSEELQRTAVKEAEVLLGEAEIKAEKILDAAHRRSTQLACDIREMKQIRTRLAASVRSTIDVHLGLLDALSGDPPEEASLGSNAAHLARSVSDSDSPAPNSSD
jgi:cell division initiation protein